MRSSKPKTPIRASIPAPSKSAKPSPPTASATLIPTEFLHIATHGSFNPKTINASYFLLGNSDKLPITEIANLTTLSDKHLVVLSACETGLSGNSL
jgi:CHAT domain-containing protein